MCGPRREGKQLPSFWADRDKITPEDGDPKEIIRTRNVENYLTRGAGSYAERRYTDQHDQ